MNHVWLRRLNEYGLRRRLHDSHLRLPRGRRRCSAWRLILHVNVLLRRALQISCLIGTLAHHLNCVHHALPDVVVSVTEGGCPRRVRGHLLQHVGKLCQSFYACVPRLLVYSLHELLVLKPNILLEPLMSSGDLVRISRSR